MRPAAWANGSLPFPEMNSKGSTLDKVAPSAGTNAVSSTKMNEGGRLSPLRHPDHRGSLVLLHSATHEKVKNAHQ